MINFKKENSRRAEITFNDGSTEIVFLYGLVVTSDSFKYNLIYETLGSYLEITNTYGIKSIKFLD